MDECVILDLVSATLPICIRKTDRYTYAVAPHAGAWIET